MGWVQAFTSAATSRARSRVALFARRIPTWRTSPCRRGASPDLRSAPRSAPSARRGQQDSTPVRDLVRSCESPPDALHDRSRRDETEQRLAHVSKRVARDVDILRHLDVTLRPALQLVRQLVARPLHNRRHRSLFAHACFVTSSTWLSAYSRLCATRRRNGTPSNRSTVRLSRSTSASGRVTL